MIIYVLTGNHESNKWIVLDPSKGNNFVRNVSNEVSNIIASTEYAEKNKGKPIQFIINGEDGSLTLIKVIYVGNYVLYPFVQWAANTDQHRFIAYAVHKNSYDEENEELNNLEDLNSCSLNDGYVQNLIIPATLEYKNANEAIEKIAYFI